MKDILYVKVEQNIAVFKKDITLKDVATLYSINKDMVKKLEKEPFYTLSNDLPKKNMFTLLKVYEAIHKVFPDIQIVNIGERDFVIEYQDVPKINKAKEYCKVAFISLVVFFGAAFTIMTFNEDVSVAKLFDNVYKLIMGHTKQGGTALEFSYALGLPLGIIVFYNHFRRAEVKNDPTPIQVEMRTYEEQINKAMIKTATREGKTIDAN